MSSLRLTSRQLRVLALYLRGRTPQQIAAELQVDPSTAEYYIRELAKLVETAQRELDRDGSPRSDDEIRMFFQQHNRYRNLLALMELAAGQSQADIEASSHVNASTVVRRINALQAAFGDARLAVIVMRASSIGLLTNTGVYRIDAVLEARKEAVREAFTSAPLIPDELRQLTELARAYDFAVEDRWLNHPAGVDRSIQARINLDLQEIPRPLMLILAVLAELGQLDWRQI